MRAAANRGIEGMGEEATTTGTIVSNALLTEISFGPVAVG
jgi:hypothetical protein